MTMHSHRYASITAFFMMMSMFGKNNGNYTRSTLERLIEDKRRSHNKLAMPVMEDSKPLTVNVGFIIRTLKYIDDVREFMSVVASLEMHWHDDRLKWNKSDYGGIESFLVKREDFWIPFVIEVNSIDNIEMVGNDPNWPMRVLASGDISFFPVQVLTVSCPIDISLYPLDIQTCPLEFVAFGSYSSEIQFATLRDDVETTFYVVNSAWELRSSSVKTHYENVGIALELTFARRPSVIVMNVIAPIVFMSFLNCVAFIIPVESGEKISYSMTIVLAITVFLTLVSGDMPQTAESVAVLNYYLLAVLSQAVLMSIATIVNVKLYYRKEDETPGPLWSSLVTCVFCKKKDIRDDIVSPNQVKYKAADTVINTRIGSSIHCSGRIEPTVRVGVGSFFTTDKINTNGYQSNSTWNRNKETQKIDSYTLETKTETTKITNTTWKDVSETFDRIFFILSLLLSIVFAGLYFGYVEMKSY